MRGPFLASVFCLILFASVVTVQASVVGIGPNLDITASNDANNRQQVEPTIAVDPRNPDIIVAGAQDLRLVAEGKHRWHGYYRSVDGGLTWSVGLLPGFPGDTSPEGISSPLQAFNATSDPVLAFDRQGNAYYTGIAFNIHPDGSCCFNAAAFVAKFVNDGADYAFVSLIFVRDADKPWIAVDTSGGPYDGNIYVAFQAAVGSVYSSVFTRSVDGGLTFSAPFLVPQDSTGGLPGVAVDPAGNVYVSSFGFDPVTGASLNIIQVSKLTGGGSVLEGTVVAVNPAIPIPSPLPGGQFRTFTIPQIAADNRGIYVVWDDFRTGDADVLLAGSTDGGTTWSSPVRVNDVAVGSDGWPYDDSQFFPTIASSAGIISVAWYDSRFSSSDICLFVPSPPLCQVDVFYAQSVDGGVSFSPSLRVTSVSFDPNTVLRTDQPGANFPFIGDYIHIAASPTSVYPIWTDNRNAFINCCLDQDVFTSTVTVALPPPDFSISASPSSLTVIQGSGRTSTVNVAGVFGFSGDVNLTVTVSPAVIEGPTGSLNPTMVTLALDGTGASSLSISTVPTTPIGTYTVTVTGSSGSLSHSTTLNLNVISASEPNFARGRVHWTHKLSLSKTNSTQTWTAIVENPNPATEVWVNVHIDGLDGSGFRAFSADSGPFLLLPQETRSDITVTQTFSSSQVGMRFLFTATIRWGSSPAFLTLVSSSAKSGSFTVGP